jgi:hypothetical protein
VLLLVMISTPLILLLLLLLLLLLQQLQQLCFHLLPCLDVTLGCVTRGTSAGGATCTVC